MSRINWWCLVFAIAGLTYPWDLSGWGGFVLLFCISLFIDFVCTDPWA